MVAGHPLGCRDRLPDKRRQAYPKAEATGGRCEIANADISKSVPLKTGYRQEPGCKKWLVYGTASGDIVRYREIKEGKNLGQRSCAKEQLILWVPGCEPAEDCLPKI